MNHVFPELKGMNANFFLSTSYLCGIILPTSIALFVTVTLGKQSLSEMETPFQKPLMIDHKTASVNVKLCNNFD